MVALLQIYWAKNFVFDFNWPTNFAMRRLVNRRVFSATVGGVKDRSAISTKRYYELLTLDRLAYLLDGQRYQIEKQHMKDYIKIQNRC